MKPFAFRLDRILEYRKHLERRAQAELAKAEARYRQMEREAQTLNQKRRQVAQKCSDEEFKGINAARYQIYQTFVKKLELDLEKIHLDLKEKKKQISAQTEHLKRESMKKKTLESLKERQYQRHMQISAWEEQKAIDEIVVIGREPSQ